jgi:type I restriction enzyme R subunit
VARFKALDDAAQEEFKSWLVSFRNLYAFLSQIVPYQDADLEKSYTFMRFFLAKLPRRSTGAQYHFDDEVSLRYYRLQKISEGAIVLEPGAGGAVYGPTEVGTGADDKEKIELSRLIDLVNDRFGTQFTPRDELFFDQVREDAIADEGLKQAAKANTLDNFAYVFDKALEGFFIDRMEQNQDIFAKFMNDADFKSTVAAYLRSQVYQQIRGGAQA